MIAGADRRRDYVRLHMQWALAGAFVLRFPAIAIHFLGWMFLLASLIAVSAMPRFGEVRRNTGRMKAAWGLSVFGTVVGVVTLPAAFPQDICSIICLSVGTRLLFGFYFPFVPSVFASAVVGHALIFRSEAGLVASGPSQTLARAGQTLLVLAVVSLAIQVAGSFGGPAYLLAGLSSIGYFQAATGLWRPLRARL